MTTSSPRWISERWLDTSAALPPQAYAMLPPLPEEEHLLGLHEVEHAQHKKSTSWLLVSTHRTWLFIDQGRSLPSMIELRCEHLTRSHNRFSRDTLDHHGEPEILIPRLFQQPERELIDFTLLEPEARAFQAAKILSEEHALHHEAATLLRTAKALSDASRKAHDEMLASQDVVTTSPESVLASTSSPHDASAAPLTRHERILVWMAKSAIAIGAQGQAIDHLIELTQARPKDDLIASTMSLGQDDVRWWLPIALAHEEARDFISAAAVYDRLYTLHPAHRAFLLSQARCLRQAMRTTDAISRYEQYIQQHVSESAPFPLLPELTGHEHTPGEESPPGEDADDFFLATSELAALYASRAEWLLAMETHLTAIQQRPFLLEGYTLLLNTLPHVKDSPTALTRIAIALDLLAILQPDAHQRLLENLTHTAPTLHAQPMPPEFARHLEAQEHETVITHPGEHMRQHGAQKWLSGLMIDKESTRDIERHCERLSPTRHTVTFDTLTRLAGCLGVPTPRCYLSHGMTGVQVFGEESSSSPALMLMGAAHLDEEHPQYLSPRPMAFALGTQLEHIRAEHLVLTSSEFWGAFRDRALSGGIALLSLIPVGSAIGKFADGIAAPLLEQLKKGFDNNLFQSLLRYLEKQVEQGAAHGHIQSAYESTIGALLLSERRAQKLQSEPQSLVKEELADFARCAMYTADRFGLVACDDLASAVEAILLLSSLHGELTEIKRLGLKPFLEAQAAREEGARHEELAMRLSELFGFALSKPFATLRQDLAASA